MFKKRKTKNRILAKEILDSLDTPGGKRWFIGKNSFDTTLAIETINNCIEKLNQEKISSSWQRRSTCVTSFFFYLQNHNAHEAYHALYEIIEGFNRDTTEEISEESIAFYKALLHIYNKTFEKNMKNTICSMKKEDWLKLDQDLEYYDKNQIKYDLTKLPVLKSIMRDLCLNLENIKKIPDFILNGDQFQCLLKQIKELNELLYSLSDESL